MGAAELETALALLWLGTSLILTDRATDTLLYVQAAW